jgi:hypothetical protein
VDEVLETAWRCMEMATSLILPRRGISRSTIRLFVRQISIKPNTKTFLIVLITNDGEILWRLQYSIHESRLDWTVYRIISKKLRRIINNSEAIDNEYLYRITLNINYIVKALRKALRRRFINIRVIKIQVSRAELDLAEYLRGERIRLKLKTYITRRHLVDFLILPRGGRKIVLDIAYPYENADELEGLLSERKRYLLDNGYLYYWVTVKQLHLKFHNITRILKNIIEGREARPSGPLMDIVKLEETSTPTQFLLKLEARESAPDDRISIGMYEVIGAEKEETLSKIGDIRVEGKDIIGFAQSLCNLLGDKNYYSYNLEDYEKLYDQLIEDNHVSISVKKVCVDSRELLTRQLIDDFTDDLLMKIMSTVPQLLRDHQIVQLESIPLEVVRSFFEDYICRMRPLTGERLEKLISHGLLNENKRRTVIGRMLMKAFRETMKNQTYAHGDTRHVLLNNSGADLYGKRV